jgi:hypothetical protein
MEITKTKLRKVFGAHVTSILSSHLKALPRSKGTVQKYEVVKDLPTEAEFGNLRAAHFTATVDGLVSDAYGEFESLASELSDWYDALPESFQQGDKGSQLEDAKGILENLSPPDVPPSVAELKVVYIPAEDASSRADRCSDACGRLTAAKEAVAEYREELETLKITSGAEAKAAFVKLVPLFDDDGEMTKILKALCEGSDDEALQKFEEDFREDGDAENMISELENAIGEAEGVEFPGMY